MSKNPDKLVELNLRTGEKNIYDTHDLVRDAIENKIETAYGQLGIKISIDEIEDGEQLVDEFYKSKGYYAYNIKQKSYGGVLEPEPKNKQSINEYLQEKFDLRTIDKIIDSGCPDYLIIDWENQESEFKRNSVKDLFFVEAKHKTDNLRPSQIEWIFHEYRKIPVTVCFTYPPEEVTKK